MSAAALGMLAESLVIVALMAFDSGGSKSSSSNTSPSISSTTTTLTGLALVVRVSAKLWACLYKIVGLCIW